MASTLARQCKCLCSMNLHRSDRQKANAAMFWRVPTNVILQTPPENGSGNVITFFAVPRGGSAGRHADELFILFSHDVVAFARRFLET